MQLADCQGLIHIVARTNLFARMVADAAANARKRVVFFEKFQGFPVFALVDQGNIALDAYMRRTGGLTRGCPPFFNSKSTRYGLGVFFEGRLTRREPLVIFIGAGYGADFGTFTAAGAFIQIDVAGCLVNRCRKIARFPFQVDELRIGEQFNVEMPADLDQFGRNDSHGTVVGGEGLIQLGHESADRR
jgi:hypothetical protein